MSDDFDHAAMPALDAQWLTRYRSLSLAARPWRGRSLVRPTRYAMPVGGTEAVGVRDYSPGDELRWVDWKWCARRDEVLTRTFVGRQDRPMTVLLDVSRSMAEHSCGEHRSGPRPGAKFRMAQRLAAAAACEALDAMSVLRLLPFSASLRPGPPPLRDRWRVLRLLQFLDRLAPDDSPTDVGGAVAALARQPGGRGPVLVISDLLDGRGFVRALDQLRHQGYEPRVVHLHAGEHVGPQCLGDVEWMDCETGRRQRAVVTERVARRYRQLFQQFLNDVAEYCRSRVIPWLQLDARMPVEQAIGALLGLPMADHGAPNIP